MSGTQRRTPPAVIERLLEDPHRFGFFQAVRLLQRWLGRAEGLSDRRVLDERLRFRNSLSLDFPASEVAQLRVEHEPPRKTHDSNNGSHDARAPDAAGIRHIEVTPSFIGLLGVTGALPVHYTELLAQRETYHRDHAARAFLDIFQHRAVALFYEGWRKHRLALHDEADGRNRFLPLVLAVAGLGQPALRDRLLAGKHGVSDHAVAFYAGAVHKRNLSPQTLERLVSMYFDVRAKLTPFIGRWYALPPSQHSLIGLGRATLGSDAVVGERVWQRDLRVRLELGPLDLGKFNRFLPGGPAQKALRELLQLLGGSSLEYEVCLHLRADEVHGSRLDPARGAWLGWNSFLITKLQREDRSDVRYDLLALT